MRTLPAGPLREVMLLDSNLLPEEMLLASNLKGLTTLAQKSFRRPSGQALITHAE
jgi:hypothetical protein